MTRLIATRKWGLLILFQCIAASVVFLSCDFTRGLDSEGEFDYYEDKPEYLLKGLTDWTNSDPFSLDEAEGKVVLVDFWTYTCINCIRTLPWLKDWHYKYSDNGLIILGIHSPEFHFEKNPDNVRQAVEDFGIRYPVALDNGHMTWDSFRNNYWPAKYIFDKNGNLQYSHFGEGAYLETEEIIRQLLVQADMDISGIKRGLPVPSVGRDISTEPLTIRKRQTQELYTGSDWNRQLRDLGTVRNAYIGNEEYFDGPDELKVFLDPGSRHRDQFYLEGSWVVGREKITHGRETGDFEDYIALKFSGSEVNVVLSVEDFPYLVKVTLDGKTVENFDAGNDLIIDRNGSFLRVDRSAMYNVLKLDRFDTRELKLSSNSSAFSVYAFTFGSSPVTSD